MNKPDKAIQVRLPGELAERISQLAEREFRSLNGEILYLIQRGLDAERRGKRIAETEEGVEDKIQALDLVGV